MFRNRDKKVISRNKFYRVYSEKGGYLVSTLVKDSEGVWQKGYGTINKEKTHLYCSEWDKNLRPYYRYVLHKDLVGNLQTRYDVHFKVLFQTF